MAVEIDATMLCARRAASETAAYGYQLLGGRFCVGLIYVWSLDGTWALVCVTILVCVKRRNSLQKSLVSFDHPSCIDVGVCQSCSIIYSIQPAMELS